MVGDLERLFAELWFGVLLCGDGAEFVEIVKNGFDIADMVAINLLHVLESSGSPFAGKDIALSANRVCGIRINGDPLSVAFNLRRQNTPRLTDTNKELVMVKHDG